MYIGTTGKLKKKMFLLSVISQTRIDGKPSEYAHGGYNLVHPEQQELPGCSSALTFVDIAGQSEFLQYHVILNSAGLVGMYLRNGRTALRC